MAGLDTRGMMDGFTQGFGLMQNYFDGQDRKALAQQHMGLQMQQQEMQQRGLDMREQEFASIQQERKRQSDQQYISQFYNMAGPMIESGDVEGFMGMFDDPEAQEVFGRNKLADFRHVLNPKTVAATEYAGKLAAGEGRLFSDTTAEHMNDFFSPVVNRFPGRQTRIAGVYPGQQEGTMVFDLGVMDDGGLDAGERFAPMTKNRGRADEDDEVMQVPIDDMVKRVQGIGAVHKQLGPERIAMAQAMMRRAGYLPEAPESWEQVQGPGGSLLQRNSRTGEMKALVGRAPRDPASAPKDGRSDSKKKYDEMVAMGRDPDEAFKFAYGGMPKASDQIKQQERQEGIGSAYEQSGHVLSAVNDLLSEGGQRGIDAASGMWSLTPSRRGGAAYDAELKLEQLTSMLQLENMGAMKGVLSDSDMKVIRAASSGLDVGLSTDQINERLYSIRQKLQTARNRTASKAEVEGINLEAYGAPASAEAVWREDFQNIQGSGDRAEVSADDALINKYLGGN